MSKDFIVGEPIGTSSWVSIDQAMITAFGHNTLDPDPMHIDPEWAHQHSPYGGTIAFGFQTMSLLTHLLYLARDASITHEGSENVSHFLNYGFDRVRLLAPIPAGARVRGVFRTLSAELDDKGREKVKVEAVVEVESQEQPALVAEWLFMHIPSGG